MCRLGPLPPIKTRYRASVLTLSHRQYFEMLTHCCDGYVSAQEPSRGDVCALAFRSLSLRLTLLILEASSG